MNIPLDTEKIKYNLIKPRTGKINKPFENDFWEREALANRLTDHISRINVGATIAIDAEWGAGKTWFVENWQEKLKVDGFEVIYLNSFNQDYIDDPFLIISMEIANCLKSNENDFKAVKEKIGEAYRAILPNLPILLWYLTTSLGGMGAIAKPIADIVSSIQDSDSLGKEAGKLLNEKLQEHLSAQVENYDKEKQSLEYFRKTLGELTSSLDKPLVFIVDELDRCKPEFAIRLIERIKHFFDIPNVVFVLAINKKQLEESINNFYGFSKTSNYLEKFIDFSVMLKSKDLSGSKYFEILKNYNERFQLDLQDSEIYTYMNLCKLYTPNPRQLIKIINKFSLLKGGLEIKGKAFLFLFLIYSELRLIFSYNENEFIEHFYKINDDFYKNDFHIYNHSRNDSTPVETKFINFLSNVVYRFNNYNPPFEQFLYYINDFKTNNLSNSSRVSKNFYYPTSNKSNDLIDEWYKYVHMIDG